MLVWYEPRSGYPSLHGRLEAAFDNSVEFGVQLRRKLDTGPKQEAGEDKPETSDNDDQMFPKKDNASPTNSVLNDVGQDGVASQTSCRDDVGEDSPDLARARACPHLMKQNFRLNRTFGRGQGPKSPRSFPVGNRPPGSRGQHDISMVLGLMD